MTATGSDALDRALEKVEAFDALAALVFASFAGVPSVVGQQPVTVPTVMVELVWARLLRRGTIRPPGTPGQVDVEAVTTAALVALPDVNSGSVSESDPTGLEVDVHRRFGVHGLYVYDPAMPELEAERWPALFADFDDELQATAGLRVSTIERLVETLQRRTLGWCLAYAQAPREPQGPADVIALICAGLARGAGAEIRPGLARKLTISREQLAHAAGVSTDEVAAFCELLATRAPIRGADRPFNHLVWPLRRQPILEWEGRLLVPVLYNLGVAIRPALEAVLRERDPKAGAAYDLAKGKWVEAKALELLSQALGPDQAYRKLEIPEPVGTSSEHDGLVRLDLTAVALEVKGGGVSPAARRGHADSQDRVLERLLHEGVEQADRTISALRAEDPITGIEMVSGDRQPVDVGSVTEFMPLVVTLEDMSGVVASFEAAFAERPHYEPYPIVLTLDDLVWYADELRSPARLLHYLRVRERIGRSPTRMVVFDEADWFRSYLSLGGAGIQDALTTFEGLSVPVLTQGGSARRGYPDPHAGRWETPFADVLERWSTERTDGWLAASMAMLDLSDDQAERLGATLNEVRELAGREEAVASATILPAGDPRRPIHVLAPFGSGSMTMLRLGAPMQARVPDATEHIVLATYDGDPQHLDCVGLLGIDVPGANEPK